MALQRTDTEQLKVIAEAGRFEDEDEYSPVLLRYKTAGAGVVGFQSPTGDVVKQIEGIVVMSRKSRGYWVGEYEGGNEPADCATQDGKAAVGIGDPGGVCATCPMNAFGTALRGGGKACKETRRLIVMADGIGPVAYNVPPSSLKQWDGYCQLAHVNGFEYWQTKVRLGMRAQDAKGEKSKFTYSQLVPEMIRQLTPAEAEAIRQVRGDWLDYLRRTPIEASDEVLDADAIEV